MMKRYILFSAKFLSLIFSSPCKIHKLLQLHNYNSCSKPESRGLTGPTLAYVSETGITWPCVTWESGLGVPSIMLTTERVEFETA